MPTQHASHWLRKLPKRSPKSNEIAKKIEEAEERMAGLKEQLQAVAAVRASLEAEAQDLAEDQLTESEISALKASGMKPRLESGVTSAGILRDDLLRVYVDSGPFLSELVMTEMDKLNNLQNALRRWASHC